MSDISLEARIQWLADIEAIRQLKARYCMGCDDDHNPDTIIRLFIPEGVWTTPGLAHCEGRDEIWAFMADLRASGRIRNSAHMVMNPLIEPDGDHATAHWRFVMMYTGNISGGDTQYHRIIGHYQDELVRRDHRWYFARLQANIEESDAYPSEPSRLD